MFPEKGDPVQRLLNHEKENTCVRTRSDKAIFHYVGRTARRYGLWKEEYSCV